MNAYFPDKQTLVDIVSRTVKATVNETLPEAIRKATRKEWLTTEEVMEVLSCSRRHVQYLRDSGSIEFSQDARTIRYHIEDVEEYLNRHKVEGQK